MRESWSGVRALVWIDREPLLAVERLRCERAEAELERVRSDLERASTEWEPRYSKWFHGHYGEKVTRVRELEAKAGELDHLISCVQTEALISGTTLKSAHARIERIRVGAEKTEEMRSSRRQSSPEDGPGSFRGDRGEEEAEDPHAQAPPLEESDELPPEVEEFLKMSFEQMFNRHRFSPGEYARMFEGFKKSFREQVLGEKRASGGERRGPGQDWTGEGPRHGPRSRRKKRESADRPHSETTSPMAESSPSLHDRRFKQLYRDLSRRLHPDLNGSLSFRKKELWHEVRIAYVAGDLGALETLAALVDSGSPEGGYSKIQSVSTLRSIVAEFQKKLKAAQKAVRSAKKEPFWNFTDLEKDAARLQALGKRIERELREATHELEIDVAEMEREIERWKKPPPSRSTQRKQPGSPRAKKRQKD